MLKNMIKFFLRILCLFIFMPTAFSMSAGEEENSPEQQTAVFIISDQIETSQNSHNEYIENSSIDVQRVQTEGMIFPKNRALYAEAQSYRTEEPDSVIVGLQNADLDYLRKTNVDRYVAEVAKIINENSRDDFHKTKMINDLLWLVMEYDVGSYFSGNTPNQDYRSVLSKGLAVCEGFSNVFFRFCVECGIKCRIIHGYARGAGTSLQTELQMGNGTNHAWNIVTINGRDYLVDSTWNVSALRGTEAVKNYNTQWLFSYPEAFIYTHYPVNASDQLLDVPISRQFFYTLPSLRPYFFDAVESVYKNFESINSCDGVFESDFSLLDKNTNLSLTVKNMDSSTHIEDYSCAFVFQPPSKTKLMMSFHKEGTYKINLYAGNHFLGEFLVKSNSVSEMYFPDLRPAFFDVIGSWPARLDSVITCDGNLEYEFLLLDADADISFMIKDGNSASTLDSRRYFFTYNSSTKKIKLMASFPRDGMYQIYLFGKQQFLGSFIVKSTGASKVKFPDSYSIYGFENGGILNAPIIGPLKKGETVFFSVQSKRSMVQVLVTDSKTNRTDWIPLKEKGDGTFEGNIFIPASTKELCICVKKLSGSYYDTLVKFELE